MLFYEMSSPSMALRLVSVSFIISSKTPRQIAGLYQWWIARQTDRRFINYRFSGEKPGGLQQVI